MISICSDLNNFILFRLCQQLKSLRFQNAEMIWCQEEPKNQGAWSFMEPNIEWVLSRMNAKFKRPIFVGRPASASPATGLAGQHKEQQKLLVDEALNLEGDKKMTDVRVPTLGESVTEATVATWFKQPGDNINMDEMLCELETDKVTVEVPSPAAGVMGSIVAQEGSVVSMDALLTTISEGNSKKPENEKTLTKKKIKII